MIRRRALLAGFPLLGLSCTRREGAPGPAPVEAGAAAPAASVDPPPLQTKMLVWTFGGMGAPSPVAVVLVPTWGAPGEKFPFVVTFHGRGESVKPPEEGVMGWPRDYGLARAFERIRKPPLTRADLEGFVELDELEKRNAELAKSPFRGVIVVCPYVSEANLRSDAEARRYGAFLTQALLPRLLRETPAILARDSAGIDGVSLGGAFALRVGLLNPALFGAVSGIQPAVHESQTSQWTELAKAARAKNPKLKLRLLTSLEDGFRADVTKTSEAWRAAGVEHDFSLVPGPHDYAFNRGPGSYELLLWHDRALSRG